VWSDVTLHPVAINVYRSALSSTDSLGDNNISIEGAIAIADALKVNTTLTALE
jgi:hypothetical protein